MSYTICIDTTTQPVECTHPFDYVFKLMDDIYNSDGNTLTKFDILNKLLKEGLLVSNCNICCPNCEDVYILSSVDCFLKIISEITINPNCCLNIHASIETYIKYIEDNTDYKSNEICCNTNFNNCINDFLEWFNNKYLEDYSYFPTSPSDFLSDVIRDLGIIELGTVGLNQTSILCKLIELFDTYNLTQGLTAKQFLESFIYLIFSCFLNEEDGGIVIKCYNNGTIYIGQIESFLLYEQTGI